MAQLNKKQLIVAWAILVSIALVNSGCALVNTAVNVGIAYGIYQATK